MAKRRLRKLIWWMLLLLALRGLVPVGFMVDASHGELAIVVCPGHIVTAQDGAAGSGIGHDAESHAASGQDSSPGSAPQHSQPAQKPCPFTVASGPAPLAAFAPVLAHAQPIDDHQFLASTESESSFGPIRAQLSRAPPVLS